MMIPVNQDQQQRLLDNSRRCMMNAQSQWAKKYWERVHAKLLSRFERQN